MPSELRLGDWVQLVLPGRTAGCIGARTSMGGGPAATDDAILCVRREARAAAAMAVAEELDEEPTIEVISGAIFEAEDAQEVAEIGEAHLERTRRRANPIEQRGSVQASVSDDAGRKDVGSLEAEHGGQGVLHVGAAWQLVGCGGLDGEQVGAMPMSMPPLRAAASQVLLRHGVTGAMLRLPTTAGTSQRAVAGASAMQPRLTAAAVEGIGVEPPASLGQGSNDAFDLAPALPRCKQNPHW